MLDTRLSDATRYPLKVADLLLMSCDRDMAPIKQVWAADPDVRLDDLPNMAMDGDWFYRPLWKDKNCAPWTGSVMAIDPSGRGNDETTYSIVKILHGVSL